jgi:molybdopterin-guanine dinucleotide biosynthesis protein B
MKVIGLAGWSGAGKTTLLTRLIPHFLAQGLRISTVKHAHHDFDVDVPGKDSWLHPKAGASEVLASSSRRWAMVHELGDVAESRLPDLLAKMSRRWIWWSSKDSSPNRTARSRCIAPPTVSRCYTLLMQPSSV